MVILNINGLAQHHLSHRYDIVQRHRGWVSFHSMSFTRHNNKGMSWNEALTQLKIKQKRDNDKKNQKEK